MRIKRSSIRVLLIALLASFLVAVSGAVNAPKANATLATCAIGSAAQNSIAVEPSHPTVMYIDSGMNPRVDAAYVGYRISNRTGATLKGYWASLDNFTGGVVSLANPLDKYMALPEIANNETKTVYFLIKATASTKTAQAHDFKVFSEYPGSTSAVNKYGCNFAFSKVAETIKASANKPTSTVVSTIGAIGTTFTVTSKGATGTIGAGNPDVGRILWFTPAAYSNFPTRAFRLESVAIRVNSNKNYNGDSRFYSERTFIKTDTYPVADPTMTGELLTLDNLVGKRFYENIYTFRVIDAASASIVPIAQISSGTQIKHSVIDASGTGILDSTGSTLPATISKTLSSVSYSTFETPTIGGTRYTAVPYKITLNGTTSTSVTADQVVDNPATGAIYKTGSTQVKIGSGSAAAYSDPETFTAESSITPQPLHFMGPFTFSSTSAVEITYTMYIPSTAGTYTNKASALIGDRKIISSTAAAIPAVNVTVNGAGTVTGSTNTTSKLLPDPLTKVASSIDTSTATINGSINANDTTTAGYFEWGTSPTLSSYTSINLNSITGNTATPKSSNLTGLSPGTTYYYRIVATSFGVRYEGAILDFRTLDQKATPTITTDAPTNVSLSDATLNATVDPNLTEVQVALKIWRTNDTATVWVLDDPSMVYDNNSAANNVDNYNPRSLFSGASATNLSIKMSDVATGLSSWISNGTTVYYRAEILTTTGATTIVASETKQFTFATYNDQVLTFDPLADKTWGDAAPTDSASATSGMDVVFTSQTTDVCTVTSVGVITILKVGICSIAANQPGGLKTAGVYYNPATEVIQSFTINPRAITITADAKSKDYNSSDPALTYSITSGTLVNAGDVTGSLTRASGENVGTYLISQGSVAATSNYSVTYASANLTINALAITITAATKTKVYGQSDPSLTYSISPAMKVGDSVSGALSRNAGESVGTYTINRNTLAVSSNYSVTYVSANLTITSKPLTIKAESKTRASGQSEPGFTYTLSGLSGSDSVTAVTLTFTGSSPSYNSTTPPTSDGEYVITPSSATFSTAVSSNYTITYETGTYTITSKTPQILTWTSISTKTYGDTATATVASNQSLTVTVTSLTPSICTVPNPSVSGATVTILAAGTCQLNASQAGNSTIAAATDATTSFLVNPKGLTITSTISASPKNYGDASATAGFTNSALVGSDAISGVTNTFTASSPSYNSTSVPTLAGTYTLTPSAPVFSTGSSSNYTITYVTVSYVINKKALTITASSHSVTEGDPVPTITATYATFAYSETAADLSGTQTCSTVYTTSSAAGSYASSCSGYTSDNYTITYVSGSITVAAAGGGTTYTITYSLNGGSGTTPTETAKSNGQTFTTPTDSGFSRGGYSFGGWSCNSVTTAANTVVTVGTSNITCTAIWNRNSGSSNSNSNNPAPVTPAVVKKIAVATLVTIATTPVKTVISVVTATPSPSATPKPSATPSPSATPKPSASPSPAPSSSAGSPEVPEGLTLSKTTVIPTSNTKPITFKGAGISRVAVVNEEVSVEAKRGFSGKTSVTITLAEDEQISEITAEVIVIPLPVTNPVVKEVTGEKTRINWVRSPNAIGYEVTQNGVVLCTTKTVSCTVNKNLDEEIPVEIKALGRDKTESVVKEATYIAKAQPVVPEIALVVNFDTAKYNIDSVDRALIRSFAADVVRYGFTEIDISGHTDSRGGIDNNVLSNNRAKAARAYLLQLLPNLKVTINGYADAISVAPNSTTDGMAANRRAEFRVVK